MILLMVTSYNIGASRLWTRMTLQQTTGAKSYTDPFDTFAWVNIYEGAGRERVSWLTFTI